MPEFDLVIRNVTVPTASNVFASVVGVCDGRVAALGRGLGAGARKIDAGGKLMLPGGVDTHAHR